MANLVVKSDLLRTEISALLRQYPELGNDEILRADMLEGETDLRIVIIDIHHMIEDAKALRDGSASRLEELAARRARMQSRIDFGRDLILKILLDADIGKPLELPEATLSLRKSPPAVVGEADPATMPDDLVKITRAIDKKKIREALEGGKAVEGFALSNQPPSLSIRVK
jgi:hypothetical protein